MAAHDDKDIITKEIINAYAEMLEKNIQQNENIVSYLEGFDDQLDKIEGHFTNGFKSALLENSDKNAADITFAIRELGKAVSSNKDFIKDLTATNKEYMTKFSTDFDLKLVNINASMRIAQITNIVGWAALVATLITKLFIK